MTTTTKGNAMLPNENENYVRVGSEAVPYLRKLIDAMRAGDDAHFDDEALEWAELLAQCVDEA